MPKDSKKKEVKEKQKLECITTIDSFYNFIKQKKKIPLKKITKEFKIDKKIAEEWANILKEHNLIDIDYPLFGGPILKWKEKTNIL
jgi:hypothetical protein